MICNPEGVVTAFPTPWAVARVIPATPPVKAATRASAPRRVIARERACILISCARMFGDLSDCRRRQPLVDEFLHPVALRLAGHQIAARIDAEAVDVEEFTGSAAGPADMAELLQRRAIEDRDPFVRAVCDIEEALLWIGRERHAEGRAGATRLALD